MSDETTTTETTATAAISPAATSGNLTPPATQDDLNTIINAPLHRERAKFADYDEIKAKATKHDEAVEAEKSETQKAIERAEAAEAALVAKEAEALRLTIATRHGITGDHLDLLSGVDEAELEAKAAKIAALITKAPRGPVIPSQGSTPSDAPLGAAQQFAEAFKDRV